MAYLGKFLKWVEYFCKLGTQLLPFNSLISASAQALNCYSCYSKNGSDRTCDDPMIRMYKDMIEPVPCILPTPMVDASAEENEKKENETRPQDDVKIVGIDNAVELGEKIKYKHPALDPEKFCVKVIGTTSKYIIWHKGNSCHVPI